jgi:hypothetical protein
MIFLHNMENSSSHPELELTFRIKSLRPSRPTPRLIELIQENKAALLGELAAADEGTPVTAIDIKRESAFGTGLEGLGLLFLIGLGKGFVEGVGEGIGKKAGEKFGKVIYHWIEKKFGDVEIVTLGLSESDPK